MSVVLSANGNIPVYRFYITGSVHTVTREVFPLNFLKTSLVDEQSGNDPFYRRTFSGRLIFGSDSFVDDVSGATQNRKDDWLYFWDVEQGDPCERLDLLIQKIVSGSTTTYWEGYFSTSEGEFDIDKCLFTVQPLLDDDFLLWKDKGDVEYNMIDMPEVDVPILETSVTRGATTWTYTRNRYILDVLEYIVDDISPGTGVVSSFFSDASNPVTLDENRFLYLTIAAKADIKRPTAAEGTTIAMISFNMIMEMFKCLNLRWTYDGSDIIVEHESYFVPTPGGIDIRSQVISVASNRYRYTKESMVKYERFSWMEADGEFMEQPIWYDSECVNQDAKTNYTELNLDVTTDIEYIQDCMADPDLTEVISDEGFVLLANYMDGADLYVSVAEIPIALTAKFNGDLSWWSLHEYYFRHGRVLIEGKLNGLDATFYTAKKTKQQDVNIILCQAFNPAEEITTELGETYFASAKAMVKKAQIEPTGVIKLNLLYGPADNVNAGRPATKMIYVIEEVLGTQSTFYFWLSEAATIQITPGIFLTCYDAALNDCDTAIENCTIAAGDYTGAAVVIDWCIPVIDPATCVVPNEDLTGAVGWSIYFKRDPLSVCP